MLWCKSPNSSLQPRRMGAEVIHDGLYA